jgi:hypothetical protein
MCRGASLMRLGGDRRLASARQRRAATQLCVFVAPNYYPNE